MNSAEILLIDDEVQIRKLLEITLESNGYRVSEAATAKEGLIRAANHPPDLILLDLGLPDENGQEVLRKLREWYDKPILIVSVQSDEENIIRALDHGANDYLIKPFRTGELLARIRSALRTSVAVESEATLEAGDLQINLASRAVKRNNEPLNSQVRNMPC
jgi:two-component system KDP operon response regulator KdpE